MVKWLKICVIIALSLVCMDYILVTFSEDDTIHTAFKLLFEPLPVNGFQAIQKYGINTEYSFALTNQSAQNIWIVVTSDKKIVVPAYVLPSKQGNKVHGVMARINLSKPYKRVRLMVWLADPGKSSVLPDGNFVVFPNFVYRFTLGKTMYLSWGIRGFLRPQIGKFYGLFPVGVTGFLLNDNVQPGDVIRVRTNTKRY